MQRSDGVRVSLNKLVKELDAILDEINEEGTLFVITKKGQPIALLAHPDLYEEYQDQLGRLVPL